MKINYVKTVIQKKSHNTDQINKIIYESNNLTKLTGSVLIPIIQQGLYIPVLKTKDTNNI